jgi:transposase
MEVLYPRCAGLDVHAGTVVACVRIATGPAVTYEHRTVATTSRGLLELADWLAAHGCTHVAMEATGVYWKLVWHVLDTGVTLVLANAIHIRNVPGRKSERKGRTYGTIVVDLERHTVIDVLDQHSSETVEQWLAAHPDIAMICRDRNGRYAKAARIAAPAARQVTDRFHLVRICVRPLSANWPCTAPTCACG